MEKFMRFDRTSRLLLAAVATAPFTVAGAAHAQQNPLTPHSMYEPPAAKVAASLAASTKDAPADLITTGEKSDWHQTATYAEAIRIMREIEKRSPFVKMIQFGTTAQGRPMYALIVSSDKAFTPALAAKTDKAVILIQSGIHSGEIEGKDTALMLVRDMVITKHAKQAAWLKSAIFIVMPVFNIDGHENRSPFNRANQNGPEITGTRAQAQQLNLNRDYIKGETPEMKGFLKLYNAWMPDFMFDNHVTDGADYQYDVTWDMAHHGDMGEPTRGWVNDLYIPELNKRMEADGHLVSPYGALRGGGGGGGRGAGGPAPAPGLTTPPAGAQAGAAPGAGGGRRGGGGSGGRGGAVGGEREFFVEVFSPRYSHIYAAVMNRPCLLVETHSLKDPKTRAWANYDIMVHSIDIVTEDPQRLRKAVRAADAKYAAMAGDKNAPPVYLAGKTGAASHPLLYHSLKSAPYASEISGAMTNHFTAEKDDFTVAMHDSIDTVAEAQEPLGFVVPVEWKDIHDQLELHGVHMEPIAKPLDREFDTWRFSDVKYVNSGEAGNLVDYTMTPVKEKIEVAAGSWWVPLNQQRARLIMALLHPAAPDALIRLGFAGSIFQGMGRIGAGAYLSVPIAVKVAEEHPEYLTQFNAKVASDPAFAADPTARLTWWAERSNYQPSAANRYPILEVWEKTW
jgi:murein tripeptide amidase MpaA